MLSPGFSPKYIDPRKLLSQPNLTTAKLSPSNITPKPNPSVDCFNSDVILQSESSGSGTLYNGEQSLFLDAQCHHDLEPLDIAIQKRREHSLIPYGQSGPAKREQRPSTENKNLRVVQSSKKQKARNVSKKSSSKFRADTKAYASNLQATLESRVKDQQYLHEQLTLLGEEKELLVYRLFNHRALDGNTCLVDPGSELLQLRHFLGMPVTPLSQPHSGTLTSHGAASLHQTEPHRPD